MVYWQKFSDNEQLIFLHEGDTVTVNGIMDKDNIYWIDTIGIMQQEGEEMEAAILVVIMIAGFTYSAIKTKESWKNRCKRTLKEKYGKEPEKKEFKRELIRNYLDTVGGTQQVDEVTWNDLNMDDVYQRINNCDSTCLLYTSGTGSRKWQTGICSGRIKSPFR